MDNSYYSSDPHDHKGLSLLTWDDIFDFQARKDGANYSMLKAWLKNNYNVPTIIPKKDLVVSE